MSTFNGRIKEIPFISVDRFDGINKESSVFFLSHCHTDHMVGLQISEDLPGPLYASEISAVILKQKFKNLQNIIPIHVGTPFEIECAHNTKLCKIVVILIPAGHCPGSVMFLFEYQDQRILYTGDFRMSLNALKQIHYFKCNSSDVHKFDTIYVDSTFLRKVYHQFPTQFESVNTVCDIIEKWIARNSSNMVLIKLPARYGLEYLCIEVAKRLGMKIHVNSSEFFIYNCVAELDKYFTTNTYETKLHACSAVTEPNKYALKCRQIYEKNDKVLIIRPTALYWTEWNKTMTTTTNLENNVMRVCYSSHASFTEIEDMLIYLKPFRVELNVLPACRQERKEMQTEVTNILAKIHNISKPQQICAEYIASKFDTIRSNLNRRKKSESETSDSENELLIMPIKRIKP